jgi:hypothetical protein
MNTSNPILTIYIENKTQCIYCGQIYCKSNKPLIMRCSHNICQTCLYLNKNKITCLICKAKFEGKDLKKFPINFLLLEIVSHSEGKEKSLDQEKSINRRNKKNKKSQDEEESFITPNNSEIFKCKECDLLFPNKFHLKLFNEHNLDLETFKEATGKEFLHNKADSLMQKYKSYNENLEKWNERFLNYLDDTFINCKDRIIEEIKKNDPLENLLLFGLINKADQERVREFTEKFMKNEKVLEVIKSCNSFDDLIKNMSNANIEIHHFYDKGSHTANLQNPHHSTKLKVNIHNFLSSYFYFVEIMNKKLNQKIVQEKLDRFKTDMKQYLELSEENKKVYHKDIAHENIISKLFRHFSQDVKVEVYDNLHLQSDINKNIKLPFILTNEKSLVVFDPMTENIKTYDKKFYLIDEQNSNLDKFSYYVCSDFILYISGGILNSSNKENLTPTNESLILSDNCFSINLETKEYKTFNKMYEPRFGHGSIVINGKLYILGGFTKPLLQGDSSNLQEGDFDKNNYLYNHPTKFFERLNLLDGTWARLSPSPHEFKNTPTLLNFEDEYIYVFDDLSHFFYYELKTDKWTTCKPSYRGSYNLSLKNFTTICYNSNVLVLGGVNQLDTLKNTNEEKVEGLSNISVNDNLYYLKDIGSLLSVKGHFSVTDTSSKIDYGFMLDNHYLLEYNENSGKILVYNVKELGSYKWNLHISK